MWKRFSGSHCGVVFADSRALLVPNYSLIVVQNKQRMTNFYDVGNSDVANLTVNAVTGGQIRNMQTIKARLGGGTADTENMGYSRQTAVILMQNFFSQPLAKFTLVHEVLIHAYAAQSDDQIFGSDFLISKGLWRPANSTITSFLTSWISTDCKCTPGNPGSTCNPGTAAWWVEEESDSRERRNQMKYLFLVLAALAAGAVGGSIGTYAVLVHERERPEQVIRAHRFELVNERGQAVSFWGAGPQGYTELAFGRPQEATTKPDKAASPTGDQLDNGDRPVTIAEQVAIGLEGGDRPFLSYEGTDHQFRVLLDLDDFERPSLWMSDGRGLGLTLGSERSDTPGIRDKTEHWALDFLPESRARMGAYTEQKGSHRNVRGFVWINPTELPTEKGKWVRRGLVPYYFGPKRTPQNV
jgi:hypothetical protein